MGIYQRRTDEDEEEEQQAGNKQDLLKNLGHILREEPDTGLDQFIHRLDVTPATLDTHLAVGSLLRRKGEVSRAIRVHQNLISRPSLSKQQQRQAQVELAQDFAQAGLLDRAERLLLELLDEESEQDKIAQLLVDIYQDEREWARALEVVDRLGKGWFVKLSDHWQTLRAHFYCEQASLAVAQGDLVSARRLLKQARSQQKNLARSYLLAAEVDILAGEYPRALSSLESLMLVDADALYAGLALLKGLAKYEKLKPPVIQLLQQAWRKTHIAAFVLTELTLVEGRSFEEQGQILKVALQEHPNLRLLDAYLNLLATQKVEFQPILLPLEAMANRLERLSHFRCGQCGFMGKQMHWLCPSCKTWSSLAPIKGLEGV
ncbi:hypothetical protein L1F30_08325 [Simiduia sp. 21SJ11W-1]|uniref:tetratricopeptide repeat protein n=1 Tax=Simiduia sp. 21SJ11W-1 TaxID=2909669 RepID=UPI00209DDE2B|nr:hypothetical protein [Simiduia sp. 21SJ11W-1]UTA49529.1 hypothetical protein L1F30_08325 [Simiduia sp. 21SJ11W-1]